MADLGAGATAAQRATFFCANAAAEAAWWPAKPPRAPEVAATSSSVKVTFLLSFELAPSVDAAARHANERAFPR